MELCCLTQSRLDVSFKKVANPSEMLGSEVTQRESRFLFQKTRKPINSCNIYWNWSVYLCLCNSVSVNISQRSLPRGSDCCHWKWKWRRRRRVQSHSWLCCFWHDGQIISVSPSGLVPALPNKMSFHKQQPDAWECVCVCVCVCLCPCLHECVHSCTVLRHWRARRVPRRYCERDEEMWEKKGGW